MTGRNITRVWTATCGMFVRCSRARTVELSNQLAGRGEVAPRRTIGQQLKGHL